MTQPNPFPSKRKKIVGYILLFVGIFIGLAEIAWSYYSIFAHISRDLLAWLVEGLVAVVSIVLMLIGYRLIGGKWRVRDERYGMDLRRRMRLGSLLFLVGYPVFDFLLGRYISLQRISRCYLLAGCFSSWDSDVSDQFVVGRRKKKQNEAA